MIDSESKERRKHSPVFWVIYILIALIFSVCVLVIYNQLADFQQSIHEFEQAAEIANIPDMSDLINAYLPDEEVTQDNENAENTVSDTTTDNILTQENLYEIILDRLELTHIEALQEINPDVIGWIYITATDISYPILQAENNDTYLHSSWMDSGAYLTAGSIFMDCSNNPDFSDFNTIIYGHRMRNETMFGKLKYYKSTDYWQMHPDVYVVTAEKIIRYDIYAAYEVSVRGQTYQLDFEGVDSRNEYIDYTLSNAKYDTGIVPTENDLILTLITCTASDSSTRWAVQAVKREEILRYETYNEALYSSYQ